MNAMLSLCIAVFLLPVLCIPSFGGEADVIEVKVRKTGDRTYHVDVTVFHDDEGWNHYVDWWSIRAPDDNVLGTRLLHHPHVNEQPFTRSLSDVMIPDYYERVIVRAHDSLHDYWERTVTIEVPK